MDSNYTLIFSGNFLMVNKIKCELELVSIAPIIKDTTESARLAGFAPSIMGHQQLFVHKNEVSKAQPIVDAILRESKES